MCVSFYFFNGGLASRNSVHMCCVGSLASQTAFLQHLQLADLQDTHRHAHADKHTQTHSHTTSTLLRELLWKWEKDFFSVSGQIQLTPEGKIPPKTPHTQTRTRTPLRIFYCSRLTDMLFKPNSELLPLESLHFL